MPGAMEATEGSSPEITTHAESALASSDQQSPEEQAMQGFGAANDNSAFFYE